MKKTVLRQKQTPLKKTPLKRKSAGKKTVTKKPLKNHGFKSKQNGLKKSVANKPHKRNLKKKQIRRESNTALAREIKACDLWFSRWVRLSSSDETGHVKCFTCDFVGYYKQNSIQTGHFVGRNSMMTRWLKLNNHPQCEKCNMLLSGNLKVYAENLEKKYGSGVVEYLRKEGKKTNKLTLEKVRKLRNHFETEFVKLKSKLK